MINKIKKNKISKQDVKDWLIIQRIRILNFIKEHKYLSAGISVFLLSCIVYLVAFASSNDKYAGNIISTINSVKTKAVDSSEEITEIDSFSTIVYDVSYELSVEDLPEEGLIRNEVVIEATFNENVDAEWVVYDSETSKSEISEDGKKLTITLYSVKVGELKTKQLYLKINNVKGSSDTEDVKVTTSISVKESTSSPSDLQTIETKIKKTNPVSLDYKLIGGTAYNSDDCSEGRCAPFGIVLGIDSTNLANGSLSGLYFEPETELILSASDSIGGQLQLLTEEGQYGNFDSTQSGKINGMPIIDNNMSSLKLKPYVDLNSTGRVNEVSSPNVSLVGEKEVILRIGEEYDEKGVLSSENIICKPTSSNKCEVTIKKGENEVTKIDSSSDATYTIFYKVALDNSSVTLKRQVEVNGQKQQSKEIDGNIYSLAGNDITILSIGEEYKEEGINVLNNNSSTKLDQYTYIITDETSESIETIDKTKEGTYTIKYYLNEADEEAILTREIKVVANTQSQILKASTIYAPVDGTFKPSAIIDDNECTKCNVTYYELTDTDYQTALENIDSTKPGSYRVKYSLTDANGFMYEVFSEIIFQATYKLSISNIKLPKNITTYNGMIVLGTYFVNANSVRPNDYSNDITVQLASGDKNAEVINKYFSEGTKNNNLAFYTDKTGNMEKLSSTDTLAYGEEVILKSLFEYLDDGDNEITNVTNSINLNDNIDFSKISYDSETTLDYYLSINGKRIVSIDDDGTLNYSSGEDEIGNPLYSKLEGLKFHISFTEDKEKLKLQTISYSIDNIIPGTTIDFGVRLTTGINNPENINISSIATYSQVNNEETSPVIGMASVLTTPFKARTELMVNNSNYDIIIDGASPDEQVSTWSIYPSVVMPAALINTNVIGIGNIKSIEIKVELPKGINYLYNENYDQYASITKDSDKTILIYKLSNIVINEWIEPIMFETNYDVDIPSGSDLLVKATIQATSDTNETDSSSLELRTSKRVVTYQNNEEIATSIYTSHSAVSKETGFDVNSKLYKNTNKDFNNLQLITILPSNDEGKDNDFSGSYTLKNISENVLCTEKQKITELDFFDQNIWKSCSEYEDSMYEGVTALKISGISLNEDSKYFYNNFDIVPYENKTDDVYIIKSYLLTENKTTKLPDLSVSVISKKITGTVWEDFDANGIMTSDEKKIGDVTFKLYDANTDELVSTTTSDATGKYTLSDLDVGDYYIVAEYNTAKYGFTKPFVGENKSTYSSFNSQEISDTANSIKTYSLESEENIIEEDEESENLEYEEEGEEGSEDSDDYETGEDEEFGDQEDSKEEEPILPAVILRTNVISITEDTRVINNINLGLTLKQIYSINVNKYITKAYVTNNLGVTDVKDYGKASLAKLDVKDINNLNIKVVYTIELENVGYYPGYVYNIKDYIPDGMTFNESYEENKGWVLNEDGYVENTTLFNDLLFEGDKKYLTLAFDISRKEAGSFINTAVIEDDDLQIFVVGSEEGDKGE